MDFTTFPEVVRVDLASFSRTRPSQWITVFPYLSLFDIARL